MITQKLLTLYMSVDRSSHWYGYEPDRLEEVHRGKRFKTTLSFLNGLSQPKRVNTFKPLWGHMVETEY